MNIRRGGGGSFRGFYADMIKEWPAMVKNGTKLKIKQILDKVLGFCLVQRHLELLEENLLDISQ